MEISEAIPDILKTHGLTLEELSEETRISVSTFKRAIKTNKFSFQNSSIMILFLDKLKLKQEIEELKNELEDCKKAKGRIPIHYHWKDTSRDPIDIETKGYDV